MASNQQAEPRVDIGSVMKDTKAGRAGTVAGASDGKIQLRPLGGGMEWDVDPKDVERVSPRDELKLRLAAENERSIYGRHW
ncbi:hypothetical protein [Streptomyces sp. H34-S4]|uniref:hypothetical protein n=1 Tax=Streptomyces sp. H34-S4 TaxID=2996463 RepID=UPI00226F28F0|nr:hypothetical protein [Streptomyces sp. H34-S4]MCY0933593.1 hypothetical protein [Streptomyces sp. H34-S4]